MDNCRISCQVTANMEKFYNDIFLQKFKSGKMVEISVNHCSITCHYEIKLASWILLDFLQNIAQPLLISIRGKPQIFKRLRNVLKKRNFIALVFIVVFGDG